MTARTSPSLPPGPAELDRWRRETPVCRDRIHLNNAGAALMPQAVLQAVTAHLEREAAIGGYEAEDEAEPKVRETYELLGRVVGAAARNMAIVENATVAFSQAMSAFDFRPGDRIITTRADYPSNQLTYLSLARRAGVETVRADDLPEGGVDPASVRQLARHARTRLVALSWVRTGPTPTLSGSPTARAGSRTGSSPTRWWRAWGRRRVTPWPWAQAAASAPTGSPRCCASCSRRFRGCGCSIAGGSGAPSCLWAWRVGMRPISSCASGPE